MKKILIFISFIATSFYGMAQGSDSFNFATDSTNIELNKSLADSAYSAGDYTTAIACYEQLLTGGASSVLYYNLGNAYFKNEDIAHAVLNYERALLLDPSNDDIKFNIELAYSKTVDRTLETNEIFFLRFFRNLANLLSIDNWSIIAILSFIIFIVCLAMFIFGKKSNIKKLFFSFSIVFLFVSILSNVIASTQKKQLTVRDKAIIMVPSVIVHSTPSTSSTELFVLHEGRKVTIKDDSMNAWKEIELEDGNVGWVETNTMERI